MCNILSEKHHQESFRFLGTLLGCHVAVVVVAADAIVVAVVVVAAAVVRPKLVKKLYPPRNCHKKFGHHFSNLVLKKLCLVLENLIVCKAKYRSLNCSG